MSDRLFPALSFDAAHVASGNVDIVRDGVLIAPDGSGPQFQRDAIFFGLHSAEGLRTWAPGLGVVTVAGPLGIGGNQIATAVNGDRIAIARTDPPRIIFENGDVLEGFTSPAFSDDGRHFACLRHADGMLFLRTDGGALMPILLNGNPVTGCSLPRFGGTTLMAEMGAGRVIGIADCNNPATVRDPDIFDFENLPLLKPHPVWVEGLGALVYSCHTNDALVLLLWGSRFGWVITRGELDQGFHDARPRDDGQVRLVWSQKGVLGDALQALVEPIDVIAALTVAAPPPDEPWKGTAPIDLTSFIVGADAHWPRHGSHEMDRTWDGRDLYWIKFGDADHWEHWRLLGDWWLLLEDRSQSGNPGNYSFHPGTWFPRVWTLGGEIECAENRIQEYDPKTCAIQAGATRVYAYTLRFKAAWSRITLGGSIGTITSPDDGPVAVLLEYDPGSNRDTVERGLFVRDWGSSRWQLFNQQTGELLNQTEWMTLGGKTLTPTAGCYQTLDVPTPPPKPDPKPDPQPEKPVVLPRVPQDITERSLTRLRNFCHDYVAPETASPEYANKKPYALDASAADPGNLADGLFYFLFETWAPLMVAPPDPGSAPGWLARADQADAALERYMRERVGDRPQ